MNIIESFFWLLCPEFCENHCQWWPFAWECWFWEETFGLDFSCHQCISFRICPPEATLLRLSVTRELRERLFGVPAAAWCCLSSVLNSWQFSWGKTHCRFMEDRWRWQLIRGGAQVTRVSAAVCSSFLGRQFHVTCLLVFRRRDHKALCECVQAGQSGPINFTTWGVCRVLRVSDVGTSPPLAALFGICAQQQMCALVVGEWASGFISHVHTGEGSQHSWELQRGPTCLPGITCCMAKVFARDTGYMQPFLLHRHGWGSQRPSTMCLSTVETEGAGKCRLRHSLCPYVDYYSLPIYLCFFSLSLSLKLVWTCRLIQCFIGLLVECTVS